MVGHAHPTKLDPNQGHNNTPLAPQTTISLGQEADSSSPGSVWIIHLPADGPPKSGGCSASAGERVDQQVAEAVAEPLEEPALQIQKGLVAA